MPNLKVTIHLIGGKIDRWVSPSNPTIGENGSILLVKREGEHRYAMYPMSRVDKMIVDPDIGDKENK